MRKWKVWKTIKIGTGLRTADDFRQAFKKENCVIDHHANIALDNLVLTTSKIEREIDLVAVSGEELGFVEGELYVRDIGFGGIPQVYRRHIYKRAQELGLKICSAEVALQLCRQLNYQPQEEEELQIGMEPLKNDDDPDPWVFCVENFNNNSSRLELSTATKDCWSITDCWVFTLPRKNNKNKNRHKKNFRKS